MNRITTADLQSRVDDLNRKFHLTDKTRCKLALNYAYGGVQVVLKGNNHRKDGFSGAYSITDGHDTKRNTLNQLDYYDAKGYVRDTIKRALKR